MTANRAASIRARLKQHPDTSKQDFNLTLTQYGLERLLYRLSVSEHAPNFLSTAVTAFRTVREASTVHRVDGRVFHRAAPDSFQKVWKRSVARGQAMCRRLRIGPQGACEGLPCGSPVS